MSLLPVLGATFVTGSLALLARRNEPASTTIALAGLLLAVVTALGIRPDDPLALGDATFVTTAYARLFVLLGALSGALLVVVAAAGGRAGDLGGATLLALGTSAIVLASPDPVLAAVVASAGAVVAVVVTLEPPRTGRAVVVAARELRAFVVAGALAIAAFAWLTRPAGDLAGATGFVGLAFLAGTAAIAMRFGSIPFHLWAARVADAAPETSLPLAMAWGPAALAVVGLGWAAGMRALGFDLGLEVGLVAAVGLATLVLASIAALVHEDLEHVVGYAIIADAGVVVLALTAPSSIVTAEARMYLLAFAVSKSALAAWAAAARATFRTRRVADLGGWARRSPPLALGLVLVLVASVGWPGLAIWESRDAVAGGVFTTPLSALIPLAGLAPVAYLGRLLALGFGGTSVAVGAGESPWPRAARVEAPRGGSAAKASARAAWLANRAPVASAAVVLLGVLGLVVGAGGWAAPEAARAYPASMAEPVVSSSPSPTAPPTSPAPSTSPTRRPSTPPPSGAASPGGSAAVPPSRASPTPSAASPDPGSSAPASASPSAADSAPVEPTTEPVPGEPTLQPGETERIRP